MSVSRHLLKPLLMLHRSGRDRDTLREAKSHDLTPTSRDQTPTPTAPTDISRPVAAPPSGSYSSYKTAEDRATFIKQQAEQRMAERLAALGLKPPSKAGESTQQRLERESREREDRVRQAEAEDTKREQERQRRLADERTSPPPSLKTAGKKPPPPPSRKTRADSAGQRADAKRKADEDAFRAKAEQEGKEQAIRDQQQAQEIQTRVLE